MRTVQENKNIIICPECEGYGYIVKETRCSAYDTDYENVTCSYCNGKRVVRETTTITHSIVKDILN